MSESFVRNTEQEPDASCDIGDIAGLILPLENKRAAHNLACDGDDEKVGPQHGGVIEQRGYVDPFRRNIHDGGWWGDGHHCARNATRIGKVSCSHIARGRPPQKLETAVSPVQCRSLLSKC